MKYLNNFKVFESGETESNTDFLRDYFLDFLDEGFKIDIQQVYIKTDETEANSKVRKFPFNDATNIHWFIKLTAELDEFNSNFQNDFISTIERVSKSEDLEIVSFKTNLAFNSKVGVRYKKKFICDFDVRFSKEYTPNIEEREVEMLEFEQKLKELLDYLIKSKTLDNFGEIQIERLKALRDGEPIDGFKVITGDKIDNIDKFRTLVGWLSDASKGTRANYSYITKLDNWTPYKFEIEVIRPRFSEDGRVIKPGEILILNIQ